MGELTARPYIDVLAGGKRAGCPSPKTTPPLSALPVSNLMAFGHSFYVPKLKP